MDAQALFANTVARLRQHEGQYAEISRRSGISYSSLVKLAQGHADNPTVARLQELIEALDAYEGVAPKVGDDAALGNPHSAAGKAAASTGEPRHVD